MNRGKMWPRWLRMRFRDCSYHEVRSVDEEVARLERIEEQPAWMEREEQGCVWGKETGEGARVAEEDG